MLEDCESPLLLVTCAFPLKLADLNFVFSVAFIPLAVVGLVGPLTAFFVLCTYSRLARRLFFRPVGDNETDKCR